MANKRNDWTMSDTQRNFLRILNENREGITLREIRKLTGIEFKTGSINTLKAKEYFVTADEKRTFVADIVYEGEVIGHKTYNDTVYVITEKGIALFAD